MPSRFRSSPLPAGRRKPALDFSVTGLIFCTIMMFIGLAAINTQANLLFGVFGLMIGILLVSFLVSGLVLKRVVIQRVMPDHMIVGRPSVFEYQITNRKHFWPSLSVTVTELDGVDAFTRQPSAYMLHAANRTSATVPTDVLPRRRGVVSLDRFQLSTSFPFGFVKRAADRRQADTVLVLPAIGQMRRELMQRFRSASSQGINARPSSGGDDEFYGVREYRTGENPRRIYWKRSAGAGPLVIKEMTRVSPPKLMLIVDTFRRGTDRESLVRVERSIAVAATVVDQATEAGLPVGLSVWSGGYVKVQPEHGKRHRLDLLGTLARLEPNATAGVDGLVEHTRDLLRGDTTGVLVTPYTMSTNLSDAARGGLVVLSGVDDPNFSFPAEVDFAVGHSAST